MKVEMLLVNKQVLKNLPNYKYFAFVCIVGLPFLIFALVPLTIFYLFISFIINQFKKKTKKNTHIEIPELNLQPTPTPKNEREFDLIVFGATGFTGSYVCEHIGSNYSLNLGKRNISKDSKMVRKSLTLFLIG
jgi:hypothetical protein